MPTTDPQRTAVLYEETRQRITDLLGDVDDAGFCTAVPTCPGWSVRDVVAHNVAVAQDFASGRLTGPPTDEETAAQVARFRATDTASLLGAWADASGQLAHLAETTGLRAPVGDIVSHEHDIRGALGRPGARGSAAVRFGSDQLLTIFEPSVSVRVIVEDAEYWCGPADGNGSDGDGLSLTTTRFEALRWRTARRSRAQLAAMRWSADPTAILGELCLFGPAASDIHE